MPQPPISNQRRLVPSGVSITHSISISAEGSVKGKYEGRKRISISRSKNALKNSFKVPFKSAKLIFLSTTKPDRKSTRLNSSHVRISYAVFCLKKKKKQQ